MYSKVGTTIFLAILNISYFFHINVIIHLVYYRGNIHMSCINNFHIMPRMCMLFGCHDLIVTYLLLDKIEYCEP